MEIFLTYRHQPSHKFLKACNRTISIISCVRKFDKPSAAFIKMIRKPSSCYQNQCTWYIMQKEKIKQLYNALISSSLRTPVSLKFTRNVGIEISPIDAIYLYLC